MASSQPRKHSTFSAIEAVTSTLAKEWLKTKTSNRPISQSRVIEYAILMDKGEWILNGETIKFDEEGHLIDGQHRLEACILAGKSFRTYVIRGLEDKRAFSTIDVGKPRQHGDIFALSHFTSPYEAAAAAVLIYYYKHDMLTLKGPRGFDTKGAKALMKGTKYSAYAAPKGVPKEELLAFAIPMKDSLNAACRMVHRGKIGHLLPRTLVVAAYMLFAEKNKHDADVFFEDISKGVGLSPSDPVYHLRERLITNAGSQAKLSKWALYLLLIKTWNKRRSGSMSSGTRLQDGEEFQKIK